MKTRRKLEERNVRKIFKAGKVTYAVTLPIDTIRKWGWKEKQKVVLEVDEKSKQIIIKDWEEK